MRSNCKDAELDAEDRHRNKLATKSFEREELMEERLNTEIKYNKC